LLHPTLARPSQTRATGREFGEERRVTILFVDLRGSTALAEARLPYDVVFLLNYYLAEMTDAVDRAGGHYSNFTGDGLMALFGLENSDDNGASGALRCATEMIEKVNRLNERLAAELAEPLAIGIGIHTGEAIVGRMGPPKTPLLSALGDAVNMAARLESATKELSAPVVASRDTLEAAGLESEAPFLSLTLRGRAMAIEARALDLEELREFVRRGVAAAR
jgi:adenylate cyclase